MGSVLSDWSHADALLRRSPGSGSCSSLPGDWRKVLIPGVDMNNFMRLQRPLIPPGAVVTQDRRGADGETGHGSAPLRRHQGRRMASVPTAVLSLALLSLSFAAPDALALELITATEAKLPDAIPRGITRSPTIRLISPDPSAKRVASPFILKVSFEPHGGASIDPQTIKVTYLKVPAIDLTKRLAPYISATGIELDNAEAPPGAHVIRVEVRDSDGRSSDTVISLIVAR